MGADNDRNRGPGANPSARETKADPAYQGAKPGTFTWGAAGGGFADAGDQTAMAAMNALLARNWWAVGLRGVFAILFGLIAVLLPGVTLAALVLLFAAYMLADGVFALIAGLRAATKHERWGWLALEGIADLVAGVIAVTWPAITVLAFVYLMGAWAIVSGALLLSATVRLQPAHGKWLMGFGGAISVIWGILLILQPFIGALVLTWWIGAYALFFGGALLVLAFRLRQQQRERHGITSAPA
ncbi:MAG: HdeD family acid-resistance protein [Stellaceae bacterium]